MGDFVMVEVQQGKLNGQKVPSKFGRSYFSFQGIPFAKPPLGELRFEDPQPPEPWTGVRDALEEGSTCPHYGWPKEGFRGSEDCLFLNVYTSELPAGNVNPDKAVMVWIHGGSYAIGSGNTELYGPDYLVDAGVVIVTINYRLGPLGFISLEESLLPGNAGLKDQTFALKWVQQNIAKFGGNPDNVTIGGESAGGSSVQYHLVSPMSKGLFHKAIAHSGSVLNPWTMPKSLRSRAFRLGEELGCKTTDSKELLNFLKSVPVKDLVDGAFKILSEEDTLRGHLAFIPIPETWENEGKDVFLPGDPMELLREGKFHNVPFLTGMTSHEGILDMERILKDPSLMQKEFYNYFERFVPEEFKLSPHEEKELAHKIKKFYFEDEPLSTETLEKYAHLNTDHWFAFGIGRAMDMLTKQSAYPTYLYQFSFDGELGHFKKLVNGTLLPGASHLDDIGYLFRVNLMDIDINPDSPEKQTLIRMVKMWTNFAKTGNPTPELDSDITVTWSPYTASNPVYLEIDKELTMKKDILKERMDFWKKMYSAHQGNP